MECAGGVAGGDVVVEGVTGVALRVVTSHLGEGNSCGANISDNSTGNSAKDLDEVCGGCSVCVARLFE